MFAAFYLDVTKYAIVERTRQVRDTFKTETFIHTITSFMVTAHVAGLAQCLLRYIANSENLFFLLELSLSFVISLAEFQGLVNITCIYPAKSTSSYCFLSGFEVKLW